MRGQCIEGKLCFLVLLLNLDEVVSRLFPAFTACFHAEFFREGDGELIVCGIMPADSSLQMCHTYAIMAV